MPAEKIIKDKKILICDDDNEILVFIWRFLKAEGYGNVDTSLNAEDALEKIKKTCYQLVLLGIRLQGIDGIQTLKRIKEVNTNIAVIMIADPPHIEVAEEAVKSGAYDYILKPVDLDQLKLIVLTKLLMDS
mgnify:CR=1 FL=1